MTAIVIVKQRDRVHIATDAAYYRQGDGVTAFSNKVCAVPHWPGAVSTAGAAALGPMLAWSLSHEFPSFDDAIEAAPQALPRSIAAWQQPVGIVAGWDLPTTAMVFLVGISEKRGPEAYMLRTDDSIPPCNTAEEVAANQYWGDHAFSLVPLPDHVMTPVPNNAQAMAANWEGFDPDGDDASIVWSVRKMLNMQRHMDLPPEIGGIGGFGQLTTISADGISQRIIERWPDRVGGRLDVGEMDWKAWHLANPKPLPANVSRLRREMVNRRQRKSARFH